MTDINDSKKLWGKAGNACGILLYAVAAAMLGFAGYLCFSSDIWYDELYSMEFAIKPISEMVKLTAADVHPPLYYIIVHFMIRIPYIFGGGTRDAVLLSDKLNVFGNTPVMYAKLASLVPLIILFGYSITIIRKRYGTLIGGLFSCAMIAMPQMADYMVEIRMYSWVMLFVTALCIHSEPFLETDKEKQIKGLKWGKIFPVFVYGLLSCYTQYYAAVAVAAVYVFLIIWSIRKNIWQLGIVLISANLTAVCYVPWIGVVLSQAKTVSSNYWIQPLGIRSLGGIIKYLMKPGFFNETIATLLAVIMFVAVLSIAAINLRDAYMWLCFMPIIGIIALGFAASVLLRPVFVYRYMIPGMGAMWFGVLLGIKRIQDKVSMENIGKRIASFTALLLAILMVVFCVRDYWAFRGNELYKRVNMVETEKFWDSVDEDTVLICNFDQVAALSLYYSDGMTDVIGKPAEDLKVKVYLYGGTTDSVLENMFIGIQMIYEPCDVAELIASGKKVLFLGSFNSREDILKEWESTEGIKNVNTGSFLHERYWFDVFELSL